MGDKFCNAHEMAASTDQVYFKGALGALVVYDISRPQTFDSAAQVSSECVVV